MEKDNAGFALLGLGGFHTKEEHKELMREYEKRKANADKIEGALMAACSEIADRLEKGAKDMSDTELAHAITSLAGIATTMGAMRLYAAKPIEYDFGRTYGCNCKCD